MGEELKKKIKKNIDQSQQILINAERHLSNEYQRIDHELANYFDSIEVLIVILRALFRF